MEIVVAVVTGLGVGFWYYKSAEKIGKNPIPWLILGQLIYFAIRLTWVYGIAKTFMGKQFYMHAPSQGLLFIEGPVLLLSVGTVLYIHRLFLTKARKR